MSISFNKNFYFPVKFGKVKEAFVSVKNRNIIHKIKCKNFYVRAAQKFCISKFRIHLFLVKGEEKKSIPRILSKNSENVSKAVFSNTQHCNYKKKKKKLSAEYFLFNANYNSMTAEVESFLLALSSQQLASSA